MEEVEKFQICAGRLVDPETVYLDGECVLLTSEFRGQYMAIRPIWAGYGQNIVRLGRFWFVVVGGEPSIWDDAHGQAVEAWKWKEDSLEAAIDTPHDEE
jgi:hypothetical protein